MLYQDVPKLAFGARINDEQSEVYFRIEFAAAGRVTWISELYAAIAKLEFPLTNLANRAIIAGTVRQMDFNERPIELARDRDGSVVVSLVGYRLHQEIAGSDIICECRSVFEQFFVSLTPAGPPVDELAVRRGSIRSGTLTTRGVEHFAGELTSVAMSQRRVRHLFLVGHRHR